MSQGSRRSFTVQASSLDQEKTSAVAQQSTSIYDGGRAAWLTVAGTYVVDLFQIFKEYSPVITVG